MAWDLHCEMNGGGLNDDDGPLLRGVPSREVSISIEELSSTTVLLVTTRE